MEKTAVLRTLLTLPSSIAELGLPRHGTILARALGVAPYRIYPLDLSRLDSIPNLVQQFPFTCVISDAESVDPTRRLLASLSFPILHVTTATDEAVLSLAALDRATLLQHCHVVLAALKAAGVQVSLPDLPLEPLAWPAATRRITATHHSVSLPNELALRSLQIDLESVPISPRRRFITRTLALANRPYVQAVRESARAVREVRDHALLPRRDAPAVDLIIASTALVHRGQRLPLVDDAEDVATALAKQLHYPNLLMRSPRLRKLLAAPAAQQSLTLRGAELALFATILGAKSAGYCAPTLLLPPAVNRAHRRLRALRACLLGKAPRKGRKLSRIARAIGNDFNRDIDPDLMELVGRCRGGIKLVSDAPLELLPLRGLPLSLRHECSRIPATPGNLLVRHALRAEVIPYTVTAFKKVLVLRSYAPNDPIQGFLRAGVQVWLAEAQHTLEVIWRDVASLDQLTNALNEFDGEIVIVDAHGQHPAPGGAGALLIGGRPLNVWQIYDKARVPPIVVLSSCETHALGASHATVANAFLSAGATTVLATLTPIDAHHAAYLVGHLLFHLADLLPIIAQQPVAVRWATLMLGVLRRMYVFDVLRMLRLNGHIPLSEAQANTVAAETHRLLNASVEDWFEQTLASVATLARVDLATVRQRHADYAYFTDTLQYVQLGSPENLLILGTIA